MNSKRKTRELDEETNEFKKLKFLMESSENRLQVERQLLESYLRKFNALLPQIQNSEEEIQKLRYILREANLPNNWYLDIYDGQIVYIKNEGNCFYNIYSQWNQLILLKKKKKLWRRD